MPPLVFLGSLLLGGACLAAGWLAYRLQSAALAVLTAGWGTLAGLELASAWGGPALPSDLGVALAALLGLATLLSFAQALRQTRERSERLAAILETTVDGVITIDEQGVIDSVNPAAERIFGYAAKELEGRNVSVLMPSPDREQHDAYLRRYLETGEARIIGIGREVVGLRRDGTTFPLELAVGEVRRGRRRLFTGVVRDVTERKRLEVQFLHAQKMEAVGRMAGAIAHDLGNLLHGMGNACRILEKRLSAEDPAFELIEEIECTAQRSGKLIRQLLDFSRLEDRPLRPVVLSEVIRGLDRMLATLAGRRIELRLETDGSKLSVLADPGLLEQMLLNLAVNARDAMPEGGTLSILCRDVATAPAGDIGFVRLPPEGGVLLTVSDTGVGMDAETQARAFEPFFTTKEPGRGTGLGLSTVFSIVRRLQGALELESSPGRGTTFRILLPATDASNAPREVSTA